MKKKYKFTADPGHGWLSVPLSELKELNIVSNISSCSYMTLTRAYLEEDCDAGVFLEAAKKQGWEIDYKVSTVEKTPIRNYPSYDSEKLDFALNMKTGDKIKLYNSQTKDWSLKAEVTGFETNKIYITSEHGAHYQVSKTRFLSIMKPDFEENLTNKIKMSL